MRTHRRSLRSTVLTLAAVASVALGAPLAGALAQGPPKPVGGQSIAALAPSDLVLGKADAPVTIEEYASLTCVHCAAFHTTVLPYLKQTYIDTGKVKFVYRDFVRNELDIAGAMLARCGGERREAIIGALFMTQADWFGAGKDPVAGLFKVGQQFGMKQVEMETCISNEVMFNLIRGSREAYLKSVTITGTPMFVVNGKPMDRSPDAAGFDAVLKPLVK
jgi:protein-disulfide isomerase